MLTTTTEHLEGYKITEYLGVVFADAGKYQTTIFSNPDVWSYAAQQADAIIGIQHVMAARDRNVISHLVGTAVKIEKI